MSLSTDGSIRVTILGDEYIVKSDVSAETTKKVAEYVGNKMVESQEKNSSRDKLKVAVLSAMQISGEFFEYKEQQEEKQQHLLRYEAKAHDIICRIDKLLES